MNRNVLVPSLLAALALSSTAYAQAPTKANAPAAAAAPAAAPAPVPVSPEMRAAVKELMETTKTRESLTGMLQQMSQSVRPQMGQMMAQRIETNASLTVEQKQQVRASMEPPFESAVAEGQKMITDPKVVDDTMDRMIQGYARTFSLEEVRQINAFYKSPTGQKAIGGIATVLQGSMQGTMAGLVPKLTALADSAVNKQTDIVTKGGAPKPAATAPKK